MNGPPKETSRRHSNKSQLLSVLVVAPRPHREAENGFTVAQRAKNHVARMWQRCGKMLASFEPESFTRARVRPGGI
jgi:hypothetical protein